MTPTDSRPAPVTPNRAPVEPPPPRHHQIFRARFARTRIPRSGGDTVTIDCPACGQPGAHADRLGSTIHGWHDGTGQCGWVDMLTIGRDQRGAVTLT